MIIARLQVSVVDMTVTIKAAGGELSTKPIPRISINGIRYYNSDRSTEQTSSLAESVVNDGSLLNSSKLIQALTAKKTVFIASFSVSILKSQNHHEKALSNNNNNNNNNTIIKSDKEMRVSLRVDRSSGSGDSSEGLDMDVSLPNLIFQITAADVKDITTLLCSYNILKKDSSENSPNSSGSDRRKASEAKKIDSKLNKSMLSSILKSDPTMRALVWLAKYEKEHSKSDAATLDDPIDYERVVQIMQKVKILLSPLYLTEFY